VVVDRCSDSWTRSCFGLRWGRRRKRVGRYLRGRQGGALLREPRAYRQMEVAGLGGGRAPETETGTGANVQARGCTEGTSDSRPRCGLRFMYRWNSCVKTKAPGPWLFFWVLLAGPARAPTSPRVLHPLNPRPTHQPPPPLFFGPPRMFLGVS
jgi:hypothetical protein